MMTAPGRWTVSIFVAVVGYFALPFASNAQLYLQMRSSAGGGSDLERIGGSSWPPNNVGVVRTNHPAYPTPLTPYTLYTGDILNHGAVVRNSARVTYGLGEVGITTAPGSGSATVQFTSQMTVTGESANNIRPVVVVTLTGSMQDFNQSNQGETGTAVARLIFNGAGVSPSIAENWTSTDNARYRDQGIGGKGFTRSRAFPLNVATNTPFQLGVRLNGSISAGSMSVDATATMTVMVPPGLTLNYGGGNIGSLLAPHISYLPFGSSLYMQPSPVVTSSGWTIHAIAPTGTPVVLQRTFDLQEWTGISTQTLSTGAHTFTAPLTNQPVFYRLVQP